MGEGLVSTRVSLHGVAELVLAGPQFRTAGRIELRATPGGFGTVAAPGLRVDGTELVAGELRLPLQGTYAELARAAGIEACPLDDVYHGGPGIGLEDPITVDPEAAATIAGAFAAGDRALRAFGGEPVLWPEHFDIAIDAGRVNYGVSPGDAFLAEPYAYVGPWDFEPSDRWNAPFGAAEPLMELGGVDEIVAFFTEMRERSTR